jgi:hypothetical protein
MTQPLARQFWIGVVSKAHVLQGVAGGFVQLNHGKRAPLQHLRAGDGLLLYSPRLSYPDGEPCQRFTALGVAITGEVYQWEMGEGFRPYRLDIAYVPCREVSIQPLIAQLSFLKDKTSWGAAFRFGSLRVPAWDFAVIAQQMGCDFAKTFSSATS